MVRQEGVGREWAGRVSLGLAWLYTFSEPVPGHAGRGLYNPAWPEWLRPRK